MFLMLFTAKDVENSLEVVLDPGRPQRPVDVGEQGLRLGGYVLHVDQSLRLRIPQRGFEILRLVLDDGLDGRADERVLLRDLAPHREERAAQDAPGLGLQVRVALIQEIEVAPETLEGRHARREDLVVGGLERLPVMLEGFRGEPGLGIEEVVEAPLLDARSLADRVDGDGAVALPPGQLEGRLEQPFSRVADPSHAHNIVDWLVKVKGKNTAGYPVRAPRLTLSNLERAQEGQEVLLLLLGQASAH